MVMTFDTVEWLSVPETAEILGIRQRDVRSMLADKTLVAVRRGENHALMIPRDFLIQSSGQWQVLTSLRGTFTLLRDAGLSDDEVVAWLFSDEPSLDTTPLQALRQGNVHPVRRAALMA